MGKGEIISHIAEGQYSVRLLYSRTRLDFQIAWIDDTIVHIQDVISGMPEGQDKEITKLQLASYEKRKEYLTDNAPVDEIRTVWCADKTEDLTGYVGTVEVPGELGQVVLQPGYNGAGAYDVTRDGRLFTPLCQTAPGVFVNWALLPHWQKFKPTYRFGTITAIDHVARTATVTLEAAVSSAQSINVNKFPSLENVTFAYMECDDAVFEEGDNVLIKFEAQDWAQPKVVGFKEHPKPCYFQFKLTRGDGTIMDASLSPTFNVKNSLSVELDIQWTYDPATQYWTITFDNPADAHDPLGYWVTYGGTYAASTQYPYRYRTAHKLQPADLITEGKYEDTCPYWRTIDDRVPWLPTLPMYVFPPDCITLDYGFDPWRNFDATYHCARIQYEYPAHACVGFDETAGASYTKQRKVTSSVPYKVWYGIRPDGLEDYKQCKYVKSTQSPYPPTLWPTYLCDDANNDQNIINLSNSNGLDMDIARGEAIPEQLDLVTYTASLVERIHWVKYESMAVYEHPDDADYKLDHVAIRDGTLAIGASYDYVDL